MNAPKLNPLALLRALDEHHVDYVLVGGFATRLHGAQRQTLDLDVLPANNHDNLTRLADALKSLDAFAYISGLSDEEARNLPVPLDAEWLAAREISNWRSTAGDVDVMLTMPDDTGTRHGYDTYNTNATTITYTADNKATIEVRVAALDDIIASKQHADRPKDHDALTELCALRDKSVEDDGGVYPFEDGPPGADPGYTR